MESTDLSNSDEHITSTDLPEDQQLKGSIGPGGEKRLFNADIEDEGTKEILSALTQEEASYLSDENMPLRHFRAEKVRFSTASTAIGTLRFHR